MSVPELHPSENPDSRRLELSESLGMNLRRKNFVEGQLRRINTLLTGVNDGERAELTALRERWSQRLTGLELELDHIIQEISSLNTTGYNNASKVYRQVFDVLPPEPKPGLPDSAYDYLDED